MPERIFPRPVYFTTFSLVIVIVLALAFISFPALAQSGVDITIHYAEGLPTTSKTEYQVNIYLSVYDLSGNPIGNLAKSNFRVTEDNTKIDVSSLEKASDVPGSIMVLVDTSDSLTGAKMENMRMVLEKFGAQLGANDREAVYGFNDVSTLMIDFDLPKQEAAGLLNQINAVPGTGSCLYDAIYTAVQDAGSLPPGKRTLIVITDGKDQKIDGSPCSTHTAEEISLLASSGVTRIPLYMVGIGGDIDRQTLQNFAALTGGRFLYVDNERLLDNLISKLSKELKAQYVLRYTTNRSPGNHKVAVVVDHSGGKAQNDRSFTLQDTNIKLSILSPTQGEEVSGLVKITADIQGGEQVGQVKLLINEIDSATITNAPYVFDWDFQNSPAGSQTITLVASGIDGAELATASTTVMVVLPQAKVSPTDMPATSIVPPVTSGAKTTLFVGAGVIILMVFVLFVGGGVFFVLRRRSGQASKLVKSPVYQDREENSNAARVSRTPSSGILATLEVLFSDDPEMTGRVLEITKPGVMIGRSLDCDFIFPQDTPISRIHVLLELRVGEFYLSEMVSQDAEGSIKRPKFGTFLNEKSVEDPVALHNGDIIRLGPRTRFRFEQFYSAAKSIDETVDLSLPADLLKTFDSTDMSSDEKPVEFETAIEEPAKTLVSDPNSEQFEKTIELSELASTPPVTAVPDPEKTLVIDEKAVPKLQEKDEVVQVSPLPPSGQELAQQVVQKSTDEAGEINSGKTLDDIAPPFSADKIAPLEDNKAVPLEVDDSKTMEDIMLPPEPEDFERTLEDFVVPPALQPSPLYGAEKTLDDISFDDSGKTMDDISASGKHIPSIDEGKTLDDINSSGNDRTLDDIPPDTDH